VLAILSIISALAMACLFAHAGWQKIANIDYYADVISNYVETAQPVARILAPLLGLIEIAVAVGLLLPTSRQYAALAAVLLLVIYLVAMACKILQGKADMDCGCAGPANKQQLSGWLLVRNAMLILIATVSALPAADRAFATMDIFVVIISSLFIVLLYNCFEQLLGNQPKLSILRNE